MPISPVDFMRQYRALRVPAPENNAALGVCRTVVHEIRLTQYFMMNWADTSEERTDFNLVTRGATGRDAQAAREWFTLHRENIRTAAMGKGAPRDYELALEWAVRSGRVRNPSRQAIQEFCDNYLGIDCSGFVTNYLVAAGKREYSPQLLRGTNAASYYNARSAINDPTDLRQGDLLVWMDGNRVKTNPGHIAVVQAHFAGSRPGGNLHVVEATGASGANPKLLDSWYTVERIIDRNDRLQRNPVMILVVRRHGVSGSTVCVIRPT